MLEDFYIEPFFKKETPLQAVVEKPPSPVLKEPPVELYEITHQMSYHLDQLEKAIGENYENPSDFRFVIVKIKEKLKTKNLDGIFDLLTELEELMDLS